MDKPTVGQLAKVDQRLAWARDLATGLIGNIRANTDGEATEVVFDELMDCMTILMEDHSDPNELKAVAAWALLALAGKVDV